MSLAPGPVKAHMTAAGMLAEAAHDDRHVAFRDLIDNDGRYEAHPLGDLNGALAVIQYTGGTTGTPKGAMLSHANLTAACAQYVETSSRSETSTLRDGEERILCILPLFHIYALTVVMLLGFRMGAELILHPRFDPAAAVKDIATKKVTVYAGVPTMHVAILNLPGVEKMDLTSLKTCGSGGAPLPLAVQEAFQKLTRLPTDGRLGHERDLADRHVHAARRAGKARLMRRSRARRRDEIHRCRQSGARDRVRRARRDLRQGP